MVMMLKPEKMCKVTIAGTKSSLPTVVNKLHELKMLHIEDYKKIQQSEWLDIGTPNEKASEVAQKLLKIRSIKSQLPKVKAKESNAKVPDAENRILKLLDKIKQIDEEKNKIESQLKEISPFSALNLNFELFAPYKNIFVATGYVSNASKLNTALEAGINDKEYQFYSNTADKNKHLVAVFAKISEKEKVLQILQKHSFQEISTATASNYKGSPKVLTEKLQKEKAMLENGKNSVSVELAKIASLSLDDFDSEEMKLAKEAEKLQAPLRFAASKNAFVAEGWMPLSKYGILESKLTGISKNKIFIEKAEVSHEDEEKVPISLKNPRPSRSFEFLIELFALPKYQEIDPTFLMFLAFPLFFGFMLGDIGYGLVAFGFFAYLRHKLKDNDAKRLINVLMLSSLSSIAFGVLFGEFFGFEELFGYVLPHLISRAHETNTLLTISVLVGLVHVNIGLLLGFYNELHHKGFKAAMLEKASWMILEIGAILWAANKFGYFAFNHYAAYAIMLAAVAMLYLGEGIKGIFELPSIATNILSYARLMAVGLASVSLAAVVNEFAFNSFHSGSILGILGGTLLLIVGHTVNLLLGMLSPFLHSIRLHYVEFFGKFFAGGGRKYQPFGE